MARDALVARWLHLTRTVLPALAPGRRWPIRADHCFMRVCLDAALGRPWHEVVERPAIRHLSDDALARAVAVAERLADGTVALAPLNAASIRWRRAAKDAPGS